MKLNSGGRSTPPHRWILSAVWSSDWLCRAVPQATPNSTEHRVVGLCKPRTATLTRWIVGPALNMAQAHARASFLRDRHGHSAGVFLCSVRVTAVLEKGQPPLNRVEVELAKLVGNDGRPGEFATRDPYQLPGANLEAQLWLALSS